MPDKKNARRRRTAVKICSSCGAQNPQRASACGVCEKERFEPPWVIAKRPVNRQVSVQITKSNPAYGESTERLTLSKWWPGGRAAFNIPTASQWERISTIIETDLGPLLGWKSARQLAAELKIRSKDERAANKDLRDAVAAHPDLLKRIVSTIDTQKLSASDFDSLLQMLGEVSDAVIIIMPMVASARPLFRSCESSPSRSSERSKIWTSFFRGGLST